MLGEKNMIQLLLNKTNFDGRWAAETLFTLFHENQKVLIIPLSQKTGWASNMKIIPINLNRAVNIMQI